MLGLLSEKIAFKRFHHCLQDAHFFRGRPLRCRLNFAFVLNQICLKLLLLLFQLVDPVEQGLKLVNLLNNWEQRKFDWISLAVRKKTYSFRNLSISRNLWSLES